MADVRLPGAAVPGATGPARPQILLPAADREFKVGCRRNGSIGEVSAKMRTALQFVLSVSLFLFSVSAKAQSNACDLNNDGRVDASDVQAAVNMSLGLSACSANIYGANVCNVVMVQRVVNASLGGTCLTGTGTIAHSVSLNWNASTSSGLTGYKIYRGTASGGPYSLLTSVGTTTSATDSSVASGQTYYYVVTAVASGSESSYSNQAQAVIPIP